MPLSAIYCRVSTDRQQNSLEGQDQRCLDYARAKGLTTLPALIFADEKVSGRKPIRERPDGARLIHTLQHGFPYVPPVADDSSGLITDYSSQPAPLVPFLTPVRHLIVARIDRLGRKAADLLEVWDFCQQHGITLHIVDMCGDSITSRSSIGKVIYGMLALFAEFEREMIVERVQQTVDKLITEGRVAGTIPFGYDESIDATSRRILVANPSEQLWLRQMAEWRWHSVARYLADPDSTAVRMSYGRIARELNARGVPSKTGIVGGWQSGNVAKVLNSRHTRDFLLTHYAQATAPATA
jgi:DNA invertase Pin-like site-specific DNA recombinase